MKKTVARICSVALVVIMSVSLLPITVPATPTRTQQEAVDWVYSQHRVRMAQCVDLIVAYYEFLGVARPRGNARDYATNTLPSGWSRFTWNAVSNSLQPGDILVRHSTTDFGHIGIFVGYYNNRVRTVEANSGHRCIWCNIADTSRVHVFERPPNWTHVIRPNFASGSNLTPKDPSLMLPMPGSGSDGSLPPLGATATTPVISTEGAIPFGSSVRGTINENTNFNRYRIAVTQPALLSIRFTSRIGYTRIQLLDSKYQIINGTDLGVGFGSPERPAVHTHDIHLEAGIYYIRVLRNVGFSYNTGSYELVVNLVAANNNEMEPNNTPEQAQLLAKNQVVTGFISYQDDYDYFRVVLTQPGRLSLRLTSRIGYVRIKMLDSNLQDVGWTRQGVAWGSPERPAVHTQEIDLEAGTYYILVSKPIGFADNTGTYDLVVNFTPANSNEAEPNNTPEQAQVIMLNQSVTGFISYQDDIDYFRLVLTRPTNITLRLTSRIGYVRIKLLDSNFQEVRGTRQGVATGSVERPVVHSQELRLEAGVYFIVISKPIGFTDNTGVYELVVLGDAPFVHPENITSTEFSALAVGLFEAVAGRGRTLTREQAAELLSHLAAAMDNR